MGTADLSNLSDEKAARMMAALRGGGTLNKFGVRARRLDAYFNAHPEYAQEARPLIEANAAAAHRRKGAHIRDKTHCVNGHSLAEHSRVALHKGWMTRQCRACERMRYRRGGIMKPEILEKVRAGIIAGSSLSSFTKPGATYMVRFDTLARYRRENPDFDRLVSESICNRMAYGPMQVVAPGTFRYEWNPNDVRLIPSMLPDNFPGKDDVIQSIFLALVEGRLDRSQVQQHLRRFMREYNRQHPTKYAKFGNARLVSLDEVLFDDGSTTRGDTVSRGLWD
jgi:hypothetical protein